MEPELRKQIKEWEKMLSPEQAKRLFIRDSAIKAYNTSDDSIKEVISSTLKEVIDTVTVSSMTKPEIGMLIANLEEARVLLSSLTQGLQIAFAAEKEPEFKAKRIKEEKERKNTSSSNRPKSLEESLAKLGLNLGQLMASMDKETKAKTEENLEVLNENIVQINTPAPVNTVSPNPNPNKVKCEKCSKEVFRSMLGMHKC